MQRSRGRLRPVWDQCLAGCCKPEQPALPPEPPPGTLWRPSPAPGQGCQATWGINSRDIVLSGARSRSHANTWLMAKREWKRRTWRISSLGEKQLFFRVPWGHRQLVKLSFFLVMRSDRANKERYHWTSLAQANSNWELWLWAGDSTTCAMAPPAWTSARSCVWHGCPGTQPEPCAGCRVLLAPPCLPHGQDD